MQKSTTKSFTQTQKLGESLAKEILKSGTGKSAVILCLQGELGAGKTTFLQGFAKGLDIKEKILSPTFILMKKFKINIKNFKNFYHFDCYRLNSSEEILHLDFKEIISNPENIVAIEWPEKISNILPQHIIKIVFKNLDKTKRVLTISK